MSSSKDIHRYFHVYLSTFNNKTRLSKTFSGLLKFLTQFGIFPDNLETLYKLYMHICSLESLREVQKLFIQSGKVPANLENLICHDGPSLMGGYRMDVLRAPVGAKKLPFNGPSISFLRRYQGFLVKDDPLEREAWKRLSKV